MSAPEVYEYAGRLDPRYDDPAMRDAYAEGYEFARTEGAPASDSWPDGFTFITELREALGMFAGAMPITPKQAWEEALLEVRRLRR